MQSNDGVFAANQIRPSYAWFVVFILFLLAVFSYTDRWVLTLLIDPIKQSLGINDVQISMLLGLAFALIYGVFGVFMGYVADRSVRRTLIFYGIIIWSLATIGCGLARDFQELFLARILVGVGEAVLTPAAVSLISDYFGPERRGSAVGAYLTGIPLGGGIAVMLGGLVLGSVEHGLLRPVVEWAGQPWRAVLLILGVPGLAIAPIVFLIKEPKRTDDATASHNPLPPAIPLRASVAILLRAAPIFLGVAGIALAEAAVVSWSPTILIREFNLPPDRVGLWIGLSFAIGGTAGVLMGGFLGDWAKHRGGKSARLYICLLGAALTLPCAAYGVTASVALALIGVGFYRFFSDWTTSCGIAAVLDQVPNRLRGLATSVTFFLNVSLGVGLGPTLVALVSERHPAGIRTIGASIVIVALPVLTAVIALFAMTAIVRRGGSIKSAVAAEKT